MSEKTKHHNFSQIIFIAEQIILEINYVGLDN